jgi:hypothetical protein
MRAVITAVAALLLAALSQTASAGFINNGDGTVIDSDTYLMWQRCTAPSTEINCGGVTPTVYTWEEGIAFCNGLTLGGYSDWRLPNAKSLQSLVDVTKTTSPNINTVYFPDTQLNDYWTSTTLAGTGSMAWYVNFDIVIAMVSPVDKRSGLYVRCVRGG